MRQAGPGSSGFVVVDGFSVVVVVVVVTVPEVENCVNKGLGSPCRFIT